MTLSRLASDIADRVICSHCEHEAKLAIADSIFRAMGFTRATGKRRRPRRPNWTARDRFLAPHEKRFGTMLKGVWAEERRVILGNMRKYPLKGVMRKADPSPVDNWLYPSTRFTAKISVQAQKALAALLDMSITRVIAEGSFDVAFNVVNERALAWLETYAPKLSENLEAVNIADLQRTLREGIGAGESMDDLKRRVNEVFETYDSTRAESIARSETIRASNESQILVAEEAGFNKLIWFANPDCCELCAELDNVVIDIDGTFFDDDYGDGRSLRHPNCRCSVSVWSDDWAD